LGYVVDMNKVSAYIIAYNEEGKIRDAVNSVMWADEVVVVDSHSKDGTGEIAASLGARVVQVDFRGFGDLRNRAIAACGHDWIFSLDADERCTPEARDEIIKVVNSPDALDAYYVPRQNFFMGKWIKHAGYYPDFRQPQLFRRGVMEFELDAVHERYRLLTDRVGFIPAAIWQQPFKDLSEILHKANRYSTLGAEKLAMAGRRSSMWTALGHACWTFFQIYILKRGILDGWPGFVIALGNFEGTFYKYAKLYERQAGWRPPASPPLRRENSTADAE